MDDADVLIKLIDLTIGRSAAEELNDLLAIARAAPDAQAWNAATRNFRDRYRVLVKQNLHEFIPPPILVLPGVNSLITQLLERALEEGERAIGGSAGEIALGPAKASLNLPPVMLNPPDGIGAQAALIGFKPPTGMGLNFDGGSAGGGGALDYQRRPTKRLSGALGLKMGLVQVSALSILEEAGGSYSLMTLLSARFAPGIQLGFGFAISGMGGLIGLNRAVDAGALEAQFRSGALVNALFGDNPLGNAVATLDTLGAVFRLQMGKHLFGPSLQLSWLKVGSFTLFNVDLGVFIQLPGPDSIDLIGSVRAGVTLVFQLRIDVLGRLDFARRVISIHGVIVDSYMMGVFKLQGELIFRMRYGDDAFVVLTIGGFFPGFNPAPAELPAQIQRIGMTLDLPVELPIYLRVVGYLAVTPNTLQFGAHMEAGFDAGIFSAQGHFILDALFQFDPFEFAVNFSAGFHIKAAGKSFAGVRCSGSISGPGPLVINAHISLEMPFFLPDINWSDTFRIGRPSPRITETADLYQELKRELVPGNLRAENGDDPHVALNGKNPQAGQFALLAPLGNLLWTQRLAPLNLELERLQNIPLAAPNSVTVTTPGQDPHGPREQFNLGMFLNLSDAERMELNARVEDHVSGVRHRFDMGSGSMGFVDIGFVEFYRPEVANPNISLAKFLSGALLQKVSSRSQPAQVANLTPQVSLVREEWRCGEQLFDTQAAAHVAARKSGSVAHLTMDSVDMGEL